MSTSLQFVHMNGAAGGQPDVKENQRAIRSQAMKDFRRRQRETATALFHADLEASSTPDSQCSLVALESAKYSSRSQGRTSTTATTPSNSHDDRTGGAQLYTRNGKVRNSSAHHTRFKEVHDPSKHPGWNDSCQRIEQFLTSRRLLPVSIPQAINSVAVIRGPMRQSFIKGFYPPCVWSDPKMIPVFSSWEIERSQATLHVTDVIGLVHLGSTRADERILMQGRKQYNLAVRTLRRELEDPTSQIEIICGVVMNMVLVEIFSATSSGPGGVTSHLAGVTAALNAHFSRPNARPVNKWVLKQYLRLRLMPGLIDRKAVPLHKDIQHDNTAQDSSSTEALIRVGLGLPGLLERVDHYYIEEKKEEQGQQASRSISTDIALALSIGRELDDWLQEYKQDGFRYSPAPLRFHSSVEGNVLGLYWSLRLLLAESLYKLYARTSTSALHADQTQRAKKQASKYATLLRETAQALESFKGTRLSQAVGMRAPLHFAKQWWQQVGEEDKVEEIDAIESALQAELPWIEWESLLYWSFMATTVYER